MFRIAGIAGMGQVGLELTAQFQQLAATGLTGLALAQAKAALQAKALAQAQLRSTGK